MLDMIIRFITLHIIDQSSANLLVKNKDAGEKLIERQHLITSHNEKRHNKPQGQEKRHKTAKTDDKVES